MAIVSLSMPGKLLAELDGLAREGGFNNRSDAVRAAVKLLSAERRQERRISGRLSAVLLLVHDERDEDAFHEARHSHEDIIKTTVHNQLGGGKCLELFILEGEARKIADLIRAFRNRRKAEYIRLVTA
jgi:CopG family transcriptional regulator, nickel-responsive regulator